VNAKPAPPSGFEYSRAVNSIIHNYTPEIYACMKCGWPVVDGYYCETCGDANPREPKPQDDKPMQLVLALLDEVELAQGGANGPTIKLRAAIVKATGDAA